MSYLKYYSETLRADSSHFGAEGLLIGTQPFEECHIWRNARWAETASGFYVVSDFYAWEPRIYRKTPTGPAKVHRKTRQKLRRALREIHHQDERIPEFRSPEYFRLLRIMFNK